ncbi:unnamed protein product, partial [Meganyctiphanes norvegica]
QSGSGRILGQVATTTLWDVSVATSTVFFRCISGDQSAAACAGRKKRKRRTINIEYTDDNVKRDLSSSLDTNRKGKEQELNLEKSEKLYGFTVWTAVTVASTVTVLTTNTETTIRLSFYCFAAFDDIPTTCG